NRRRGLGVTELLIALNRALPRRFRIVDAAEAPERLGARGKRLGPLLRLVAGQQRKGPLDELQDRFESPDRQRILRRLRQEGRRANGVRGGAGLVEVVPDLARPL